METGVMQGGVPDVSAGEQSGLLFARLNYQ